MPVPATEQAPRILQLWQGSWIAAMVVGVVVWGLIVWSVVFHRRSRHGQQIPQQTRYNVPIEVLYTVVPFLIVAVLFYFTARDEAYLLKLSDKPDQTVRVEARQWSWAFGYTKDSVYDVGTQSKPPVLYLEKGKKVQFELVSPDVIHSFWVPAFLMKMDVVPGRTNRIELTPTKEGTFAGKCAELCGVDHSRMLFDVKVVGSAEYRAHLAELKAKGQTGQLLKGIQPYQSQGSVER